MLMEVHELSELLCKIKSGKFKSETGDELDEELFDGVDYGKYPDWDDEFFEIENGSQKPLRKEYINNFSIEVKKPKSSSRKHRNKKKKFNSSSMNEWL